MLLVSSVINPSCCHCRGMGGIPAIEFTKFSLDLRNVLQSICRRTAGSEVRSVG